jgi:hypothetical protein
MPIPTNIHGLENAIEAVVWWGPGTCMLITAHHKPDVRTQSLVVATALIVFGFSDIVEISTGAWWRPWWLLVWKGTCVVTVCWQWYSYHKKLRSLTQPDGNGQSEVRTGQSDL